MTGIFSFFLFFFSMSISTTPADLVWKNRILIISSQESQAAWFDETLQTALKERKLVVVYFSHNQLVKTSMEEELNEAAFLEKINRRQQGRTSWVLIGLDGGIKYSGEKSPSIEDVFNAIDSMPMRQSEIRKSLSNY
jgi:hypothetical protein